MWEIWATNKHLSIHAIPLNLGLAEGLTANTNTLVHNYLVSGNLLFCGTFASYECKCYLHLVVVVNLLIMMIITQMIMIFSFILGRCSCCGEAIYSCHLRPIPPIPSLSGLNKKKNNNNSNNDDNDDRNNENNIRINKHNSVILYKLSLP